VPGGWTPWQVLAAAALLLVALVLRGRLLDPRRFRARDVWRPAVTLPAAMVVGAIGVLDDFNPLGGLIALAAILYALVRLSERPEPIGPGQVAGWAWGGAIALVVAACVGIAIWSAWHGLMDHAVLPPPAVGGDA
jgi:hypothetical protein